VIGTQYKTEVRLAAGPLQNRITNPNAQVSLAGMTATACTVTRATGYTPNNPYGTAFAVTGTGTQSFFNIGGDSGGIRQNMSGGNTYTARATIRLTAALGGTVHANARRIQLTYRTSGGTYVDTFSSAAPNAAGTYDLSVTVAIPTGATEAFVRFNHGHSTGTSHWYKLRISSGTQTDFFDGDTGISNPIDSNPETGWNGTPGLSTSWRRGAGGTVLADAQLRLSLDRFRVPFVQATITAPYPGDTVWDRLDPRTSDDVILYFYAERYTVGGALSILSARLPNGYGNEARGKLWVRRAERDLLSDTITLYASSGEVKLEDKRRMSASVLDTGATTMEALWQYAVIDVREGASTVVGNNDGGAAAAIPAGDRRLWMQGETASSLFESELASLDPPLRSYCDWSGYFSIQQFDTPPVGEFLTIRNLYGGDTGTVIDARLGLSRDEWADSSLIKASYRDGSGTQQTAYQNDTSGVNTKGQVVNIERAMPGSWYAAAATRAAKRRGKKVTITALAWPTVYPGVYVRLYRESGGPLLASIPIVDSVDYDFTEGTMTVVGDAL